MLNKSTKAPNPIYKPLYWKHFCLSKHNPLKKKYKHKHTAGVRDKRKDIVKHIFLYSVLQLPYHPCNNRKLDTTLPSLFKYYLYSYYFNIKNFYSNMT